MATGPLRFRTPYIEELPTTHVRHAPGFTYVAVKGPISDPSKEWGTTNKKRARASIGGQTDAQREASTARQQKEIESKIRQLNSDGGKDVVIPAVLNKTAAGGVVRVGKTTNTKKILASGKTFAHYLDDEEAEIARTGRRDGEVEGSGAGSASAGVVSQVAVVNKEPQRASKTPLHRRKPMVVGEEKKSATPAATSSSAALPPTMAIPPLHDSDSAMEIDTSDLDSLPTHSELEALLNAPPLTYAQARSAPPPASAPPPRKFCETCGYWGRVKCMKCGHMTCSVACKETHDEQRCLKFYA